MVQAALVVRLVLYLSLATVAAAAEEALEPTQLVLVAAAAVEQLVVAVVAHLVVHMEVVIQVLVVVHLQVAPGVVPKQK